MENTSQLAINSLVVDQRLKDYSTEGGLHYFWDLFAVCVSPERIEKELTENTGKYFGNRTEARNTLIRKELDEKGLYKTARDEYAKITCDKILLSFRTLVFSWSGGGKDLANDGGNIERYKHLPVVYLSELYNSTVIADVEELSEVLDSVITKIVEEYKLFEAIRACAIFYKTRPAIGTNVPVYHDCLGYITDVIRHLKIAGETSENYFQNAAAHIKQYRDMLDTIKEAPEDFRLFIGAGDKPVSQIRHDVEDTLLQYVQTLVKFTQIQTKGSKDDVKNDINGFIRETEYTLEKLGFEVAPVYKNGLEKLIFKKSGWELHALAKKK